MPDPAPDPADSSADSPADSPAESRVSLEKLKNAFATMLGSKRPSPAAEDEGDPGPHPPADDDQVLAEGAPMSPRMVLEGMLFVGRPDNTPLSNDEAASLIRGVRPEEVDELVAELNDAYRDTESPYLILREGDGYRLTLSDEYARTRERFYGRMRLARLSQPAVEVLSIVAYHQPATAKLVNRLRDQPSGALLAQLVRRELLRLERPPADPRNPVYTTTERFLTLFGLASLADLPQQEDIEKR